MLMTSVELLFTNIIFYDNSAWYLDVVLYISLLSECLTCHFQYFRQDNTSFAAITSVVDGLKMLYNEKLKPLEATYLFNDFVSPALVGRFKMAFICIEHKFLFYMGI